MSKNAKILRTKFRKFSENQQKTVIFWYFGCILYFGTLLDVCIFTLKFAKICSQVADDGEEAAADFLKRAAFCVACKAVDEEELDVDAEGDEEFEDDDEE